MLINYTVADTCYSDFAKMTGTTFEYLSRSVSVVECAFACQMNSCKNFRNICLKKTVSSFDNISHWLILNTILSFLQLMVTFNNVKFKYL